MDARFLELLPWYVNGTLGDDDRRHVEQVLRDDPAAAQELAWQQSLQQKILADAPEVSPDVGLARTLARIHQELAPPVARQARRPAGGGWLARLQDWFQAAPRLAPAFAVALLVITVQGGLLVHQQRGLDEAAEVRSVEGTVTTAGRFFRVNFRPEASEAQIRLLLVEVQGNIESGPGQLGDYYVHVPEAQASAARDKLAGAAIVESVAPVDAVPARGH